MATRPTLPQPTPGGARGPVPLPPPALAGAGSSKAPGGGRAQPRVGPPTAPVLCPEAVPPAGGRQGTLGAWAECSCGGRFPQPLRAPHHRAVGRRRQAWPRTLQPAPDAAPVGRQCGRTLSPRGRRPARLAHGTLCRLAPGSSWLLPGRALFLSGVIGVSSPSPPGLRGL